MRFNPPNTQIDLSVWGNDRVPLLPFPCPQASAGDPVDGEVCRFFDLMKSYS